MEVAHESIRGFYVSITKGSRKYLVRTAEPMPDNPARSKPVRRYIGLVSEMTFPAATAQALSLLENARSSRLTGVVPNLMTLRQGLDEFIKAGRKRPLSPVTVNTYRTRSERYLKHLLDVPMVSITRAQVDAVRAAIIAQPRRIKTHTGEALANDVQTLLKTLFTYQLRRGALAFNPASHIVFRPDVVRERHIEDHQLPRVWAWLMTECNPSARDYLLVGIFTGLRESVIGQMRWDDGPVVVDVERHTLKIAADAIGNKAKLAIDFPIADELWRLVFGPRLAARSGPWVIPSFKKKNFPARDVGSSLNALYARTKVKLSDHDLRRTFATHGYEAILDLLPMARLMGHSRSRVRGAEQTADYAKTSPAALRKAANAIAAHILEKAKGAPTTAAAPMLPAVTFGSDTPSG